MTDQDPGAILKTACDSVVAAPELRPEYNSAGDLIETFCNIGARRVAQALGCHDFDDVNLNADAMHGIMAAGWLQVTGAEATLRALDGGLAFASVTGSKIGEAHGHIAAIRPEAQQPSSSLGHDVPVVANVGRGDPQAPLVAGSRAGIKTKRNWNCRVSQAFPVAKGEPDYFIKA